MTSSVTCTTAPGHSLQLREIRPSPGEGQFPFLIMACGQGSIFRTLAHFNPQRIYHWCHRKIAHKDEGKQMAFYRNQINRHHHYLGALFWDLACVHNLDLWSAIYSLCFSTVPILFPLFCPLLPVLVHLLTLFLSISLSPAVPQTFSVS